MAAAPVGALRRLVTFLAPYKLRIGGALVALVIAAGSVLALGQGLKLVIDAGFSSGDPGLLDRALAGVVAVAVVMSAATWARFYLMMTTGERVITDIRRAVYGHLLALEPAFFEQIRTGEVISRLTNDVTQLQSVIGFGVSMFLRNALMGLGALVMLVLTSGKLAALVVLGVPVTLVPILLLGRKVRRLSRANQDRVADVSAYVDESIHEIRTVQAYGHEDADRRYFGERAEAAYASGVERIGNKAFLISAVMLIAFCAVGLILWIGGHDVLAGRITAGELSAFVFYAMVVASAAGALSETWGELQRAAGSTERLMELMDTEPEPRRAAFAPSAAGAAARRGEARAGDVPLSRAARGRGAQRLHARGRTGRARRARRSVGRRQVDRVPAPAPLLRPGKPAACSSTAWRRANAIRTSCGGGSRWCRRSRCCSPPASLENVRYGRPDATDEAVRAACAAAYALEFIERLPQGFDTHLGERGVRLSGGQRQRLSIARALLAARPVLLLDEATSSLDAASERYVQLALEGLMRGRTTLIIAHRLATVQGADRIVVMDHGRIVDEGTHAQLVRQGGLYARLAELQFLGGEEAPAEAA